MKKLVCALAVVQAASLWAIQGTIETTVGDSKTGDIKWQPRQKSYLLTYKKGKTDVSAEFALDDVAKIDVAKPQGFDKAVEQVVKGQGDKAVAALTKIAADYRMMVWDKPAGRYLVEAYASSGKAQKAYDVCQGIIADDKKAAYSGPLAPAYWKTLQLLDKRDKLESLLKKAAASGNRSASAAALVMRGNLIVADGKESAEACRKALVDGYLRVALMYTDAECAEERKTALEKAAGCLDKLGKASQAEQLRMQAKEI